MRVGEENRDSRGKGESTWRAFDMFQKRCDERETEIEKGRTNPRMVLWY
jgi:hypothetical protein